MNLTDDQWNAIQHLLPPTLHPGPGRPPQSPRCLLDAIFWKLRTGAAWNDLPAGYPSHQTCFRYYSDWERSGLLDSVLKVLTGHLSQSGFNLQCRIRDHDIELVHLPKKSVIQFVPRWQDTWQASTALLLIQVFLNEKRRQGQKLPRTGQAYTVLE
jgi:transposase